MEMHRFNNFDPNTARYSIKFLLASPDQYYENATLVIFSSIYHQHIEVRNHLAEILNTEKPVLLTAGVFTRRNLTDPYKSIIGSESLDKERISYRYSIPENVQDEINMLINDIVDTLSNAE